MATATKEKPAKETEDRKEIKPNPDKIEGGHMMAFVFAFLGWLLAGGR